MGQVVFDWSNRELALHMELRLKTLGRKEVAVDPSEPESQDIDEEARATVATSNARISFQGPGRRIATDDTHGACRINGFGHVSAAMDDLAVVAMAVELGDRFTGNFDFDGAAAAGSSYRFGHGLVSSRGRGMATGHPNNTRAPISATPPRLSDLSNGVCAAPFRIRRGVASGPLRHAIIAERQGRCWRRPATCHCAARKSAYRKRGRSMPRRPWVSRRPP